ncbi:MAG TPA: sodium:proton antiporter [Chthoniobacteraceae bacterium]|jgi:Na+/H+ antiporter NhaD/arsenite permease-like protein|nr:sodium:proton antiporter [Chthoniobacteraceae bacterium]
MPLLPLAETLPDPNPAMVLPFVALLACIALAPFIIKHHWERHYHKISIGLGAIPLFYYLFGLHAAGSILRVGLEYVSFLALIGSLFVVAGGIHIVVKGEAKPWVNSVYLLAGAVCANIIGTTGASMLLIRPWVRMNRYRFTGFHTVFFIFIISNVGGCLTPVGDPPLFLGYLKGVPFWWVMAHCWQAWVVAVIGMVAIFYCFDRTNYLRAPRNVREAETHARSWKFSGLHNLAFLALILAAVFIKNPPGLREALMIGAAAGSWYTTRKEDHEANGFTFTPIKEVAWLFAGIFLTMLPVLDYLQLHAGALGIRTEMQFYWCTGALSGVLDNAPTYLTFLASAFGIAGLNINLPHQMASFIMNRSHYLEAISLGAVFFGAMTYIGNGPNLMVKSITESAGVKTPDFARYVFLYSVPVLIPFFAIISWLFFSKHHLF